MCVNVCVCVSLCGRIGVMRAVVPAVRPLINCHDVARMQSRVVHVFMSVGKRMQPNRVKEAYVKGNIDHLSKHFLFMQQKQFASGGVRSLLHHEGKVFYASDRQLLLQGQEHVLRGNQNMLIKSGVGCQIMVTLD